MFDVAIVGLGCIGMSAAYHLSSQYKVIGFEQLSYPGAPGSSCTGDTRIYRSVDEDPRYTQMMKESENVLRDLE